MNIVKGTSKFAGTLRFKIARAPGPGLVWKMKNNLRWQFIHGWMAYHLGPAIGRLLGFATVTSRLMVRAHIGGRWVNYGVVSYRVVTTAFVNALATALHNQASPGNLYYHALGTGVVGAAIGDTGMGTELTTEYNPDGTRPTGTHTSASNVYESVGTITIDAGTPAVTEHGVMGAASGAATLIDRHTFAAVNMASGDSFVATYQLTLTAGG